jgi:hypothetical protein
MDISLNRRNDTSGIRESIALGRVHSTKSSRGRPSRQPTIGRGTGAGGGGGGSLARNPTTGSQARAAALRKAYAEVDRRVVEDSPEKTVTISTWREQVAREAADTERLSVYYVNPKAEKHSLDELDDVARGSKSSGSGRQGGFHHQAYRVEHRGSLSEGHNSSIGVCGLLY